MIKVLIWGMGSIYNKMRNILSYYEMKKEMPIVGITAKEIPHFKYVDDIEILSYENIKALFSNNEPFLDTRIIEFSEYVRKKCKYAQIHLFTNGTLLTVEKFCKIIDYLDELIIDNYSNDLNLLPNIKEIKEYIEEKNDKTIRKKVKILVRKQDQVLSTRGGDAPNKDIINDGLENETCALPFCQMVVRPSGKVSLCCNDPLGKFTVGDLNKNSLEEIWYGKEYTDLRNKIKCGRKNIEKCSKCDTFMIM